eukprot:gnl/MRDRNA2_/MRDRNA2_78633_c0_seq2.p1 gnl/MRDRNA2_/MRDRNA2_78633_c0~~gnl/MRDRNA2_/MRDRNA2_78633_c0_seq2.p1  ORF type:complete len:111 (-),score=4.54 gnl/MRDRNA2_/MRDRNA2_78633_c0_seq2:126-458(-)
MGFDASMISKDDGSALFDGRALFFSHSSCPYTASWRTGSCVRTSVFDSGGLGPAFNCVTGQLRACKAYALMSCPAPFDYVLGYNVFYVKERPLVCCHARRTYTAIVSESY